MFGKRVVQIMQWFLVFNGPNRSGARTKKYLEVGAGAKKFKCLELEQEPEIRVPVPQPCFIHSFKITLDFDSGKVGTTNHK